MESSQLRSTPTQAEVGNGLETEPGHFQGGARPHRQVWAIALAAGVAAGLASWLAGEFCHKAFKPQLFNIRVALTTFIQPTAASLNAADLKNATLVFAIMGAVTGAFMGLAGGFAGRSLSRGLIAGVGGLVAGIAAGGLASMGLIPIFFRRLVPDPNDLLTPILIHSGIWMAIGAVGGLAFAVGMGNGRNRFNAIAGACFGALLAALVYHGAAEALFPDAGSTAPLANSTWVRLLGALVVTVLIACGAARGALGRASRPASVGT